MNRRDIELLSSYLDGQLKPSDSARLEARIASDPGLRAVLNDLRSARGLLRQLPMRRAPRNFTLTPKMVGKNPPLPRSYTAFRFVTALASLMLFFTLGINFLAPQLASQSPAFGSGGGAPEVFSAEAPEAADQFATEAPAEEAPAEEPSILLVPPSTETLPAADSAREIETPSEKEGFEGNAPAQDVAPVPNPAPQPVPPVWQIVLAGIVLLGVLVMVAMRQVAASRWRRR
jgi:anti-sigma factor RsiW